MKNKKKASPAMKTHEPPLFYEMDEYVFEDITVALLERQPGVERASSYGTRGNSQYGIDVEAICLDGTLQVAQCKCEKNFGPSDIDTAAREFLKYWDAVWKDRKVDRFILVVARKLATTKVKETLRSWRREFQEYGVKFEDWDARQLETRLAQHEDIVRRYLEPAEFWLEKLCGKKLEHTQVMSLGGSGSRRFVTTSDVELILDESCKAELEAIRDAYACGKVALAFERIEGLKAAQHWDAIGPEIQAQILRLEGNIQLLELEDKSRALQLLDDADSLFEAKHPGFFEAMRKLHTEGVIAAIDSLAEADGTDEKLLLAQLLVTQRRLNEAKDVLEKSHFELDLHRANVGKINAEILFLQGDAEAAIATLAEVQKFMPQHRGCRELTGIIGFYSACAPAVYPVQLPYIPTPVDPLFVYRTSNARTKLEQALNAFESLSVGAFSQGEKIRWQSWIMAAAALHGDDYEKAAAICAQLLELDRVNVSAVIWGLSFNLLDAQQRKNAHKALTDLIDSKKADTAQVLALCALKISSGKRDKAGQVLKAQKQLFLSANEIELWETWALQTGIVDSTSDVSDDVSIARKSLLSSYAADDSRDLTLAAQHATKVEDWHTLASILVSSGAREHYALVADYAETLLSRVPTEKAFELAVNCCSRINRHQQVVDIFKRFEKSIFEKNTPPPLRRVLVHSKLELGLIEEARHDATTIANETNNPTDFIGVANIQLGGRGDFDGAAWAVREALKVGKSIPKSDALRYARVFADSNADLSRKLLEDAHQQGLVGEELSAAFFTSMSLGDERLHKKIALEFFPQVEAGKIPSAQAVSFDAVVAEIEGRREYQKQLNQSYRHAQAPVHIVAPNLNLHLDDLYHFERTRNAEKNAPLSSPALFAFSGSREPIIDYPKKPDDIHIYADLTSVLLAESLGCLNEIVDCYSPIKISKEFFAAIINAIACKKVSQPSRSEACRKFLSSFDDELIRVQSSEEALKIDASLIWCRDDEHTESNVTGEVLYCGDILTLLKSMQVLTSGEIDEIKDIKGVEWNKSHTKAIKLKSFATIHIGDGLGVALAQAGLLQTLSSLFNLIVSEESIQVAKCELLENEAEEKQRAWLSKLSLKVQRYIDAGKMEFLAHSPSQDDEQVCDYNELLVRNILEISDNVSAVWADDRFLNSYRYANNKPFITLLDIIEGMRIYGKLGLQRYAEIRLELRKSNVRYVSFSPDELLFWMRRAPILKDGTFKETIQLSILRRYINACYADEEFILKPGDEHCSHLEAGEVPFILQNIQAATTCAYRIWNSSKEEEAKVRITWLLENLLPETPVLPAWVNTQTHLTKFYALLPVMLMTKSFTEELATLGERKEIDGKNRAKFLDWVWRNHVLGKSQLADDFVDSFVQSLTESLQSFISKRAPEIVDGEKLSQIETEKLNAIFRNVWRHFVSDMPNKLKEKVLQNAAINDFMNRNSTSLITIGEYQFEIDTYTSAIDAAVTGANSELQTFDASESFQVHAELGKNPKVQFSNTDSTKNMQWVGSEVFAYLPKSSERETKLAQTIVEYGWRRKDAAMHAHRISDLNNSDQRVRELLGLKEASYLCWQQEIKERLSKDGTVGLDDLVPPCLDMTAQYFMIPTCELNYDKLVEAGKLLAKEEGIDEAIIRLSGLPIDIVKLLDEEISLSNCTKLLKKLRPRIAAPMHVFAYLSVAQKANAFEADDCAKTLSSFVTDDHQGSISGLFVGLAHWFRMQFRECSKSKDWPNSVVVALSWLHANQMAALIIKHRGIERKFVSQLRSLARPKSLSWLHDYINAYRDIADPAFVNPDQLVLYSLSNSAGASISTLLSEAEKQNLRDRFILQTEDIPVPKNAVWFLRPHKNDLGSYLNDSVVPIFEGLGVAEVGAVFELEWLEEHLKTVAECDPITTDHWFWQLALMTPYHQVCPDLKETISKQILKLEPETFTKFSVRKKTEAFGFISSFACANGLPELGTFLTPILKQTLADIKDDESEFEEAFPAIFNASVTLIFLETCPEGAVLKFVECIRWFHESYPEKNQKVLNAVDWMLQIAPVELRTPVNQIRYKLMAV